MNRISSFVFEVRRRSLRTTVKDYLQQICSQLKARSGPGLCKRRIVQETFEPGVSVARRAQPHAIDANHMASTVARPHEMQMAMNPQST